MINNHIIPQSHLIYFRKTCYIICNLKKKSKPLLNPQSKHTLRRFMSDESRQKDIEASKRQKELCLIFRKGNVQNIAEWYSIFEDTSSPDFKAMPRKVTPSPINMTSFLEYPNGALVCNKQYLL